MRVKALGAPTAEFLLERPHPAPLLLPDVESHTEINQSAESNAAIDAAGPDTQASSSSSAGARPLGCVLALPNALCDQLPVGAPRQFLSGAAAYLEYCLLYRRT